MNFKCCHKGTYRTKKYLQVKIGEPGPGGPPPPKSDPGDLYQNFSDHICVHHLLYQINHIDSLELNHLSI